MQKASGLKQRLAVDLGGGTAMTFVPIPAGKFVLGDASGYPDERPTHVAAIPQPFYLGQTEVTNAQYRRFDPAHDSAYMDARFKDRFTRGYPVNAPDQPVIRISWHQAMAFCRWLAAKAGHTCTLPTETEWEWACRAGTSTPWHFGERTKTLRSVANIADESLRSWAFGRVERGYRDAHRFSAPVASYPPNPWGLHDMHGNVAEWTLSPYTPYPTSPATRNPKPTTLLRVTRGGSWNDTLRHARSASRWRYAAHRPVYNVGFRVLLRPTKLARQH